MNNEKCKHLSLSCFYDCLTWYYYRNTNMPPTLSCFVHIRVHGSQEIHQSASSELVRAQAEVGRCGCPVSQIISADTLHDEGERSGKCLNTIPFTFPTYYNKENDGSVFVVMEDQFGEHWTCGFVTEIFVGSAAKLFVFWSLSMSLWQIFREWRTEIDMQRRTQ